MYVVLMFRKLIELITHPLHESCLEKLTVGNSAQQPTNSTAFTILEVWNMQFLEVLGYFSF